MQPSIVYDKALGEAHRSACRPVGSPRLFSAPQPNPAPVRRPFQGGRLVALSSDGTYLAVGTWYDGPPHLYIYQRNDTQYQQMANPATMPADSVVGLAFLKN